MVGAVLTERSGLTTQLAPCQCRYCGFTMHGASHLAEKVRPQAGDPCVCIACAELVVFDGPFGVVKLTAAELMDLQANPVWRQIEHPRQAVQAMHGEIAAGRLPPLKRKP